MGRSPSVDADAGSERLTSAAEQAAATHPNSLVIIRCIEMNAATPIRQATNPTMRSPNMLWRLDLTTLRYFVAICEEGSFTKAAQREAIALSAVSKRMVELEQTLGVRLLLRNAKGMRTTLAGETLLHHARQMLFKAEQLVLELAEHAIGARGFVRMLANQSAIVEFLPSDLRSFITRHSGIKINLEERPSGGVVKGVRDGAAELGICMAGIDTYGLRSQLYRRDELVVVLAKDHPLADREAVALTDTLDHDHVGLHTESWIFNQVRCEALRLGRPLKLRVHAPAFDGVCRMAQAKMGVGIVPRLVSDLLGPTMGLIGIPLTDGWARRELQIVSRNEDLSPSADLLVTHLLGSREREQTI
jgi:DNA-binding transcriptional LysR family regulator